MDGDGENVVLVTADSLRGDHCGFLNPDADATPNLDRLAEAGVTFENAIAPGPRTLTSIPETLTGKPLPHTAPDSFSERAERFADHLKRHQTLPERLSELGYTTVAFNTNPWSSTRCGVDELFDEFHDLWSIKPSRVQELGSLLPEGTQAREVPQWIDQWRQKRGFFSQWPTFFEDLVERLEDLPSPYFVWVFLMDTHNPYIVPRRDRVESSTLSMYYGLFRSNVVLSHSSGQSNLQDDVPDRAERCLKRAYRDAIRSVDRFVGTLVNETGDDPLVVFTADHGEAFGEHGTYGHQQALYEENVRVPLLAYGGDADRGKRVSQPISLRTLPDLLVAHGRDGTPVSSDEWTEPYVVARSEDGSKLAVRSEDSKYVWTDDGAELYDLVADPGETRNVVDQADVAPYEERLQAYLETVPSREGGRAEIELGSDVQQRLSLLGYDE